jgi:hypothetical protein
LTRDFSLSARWLAGDLEDPLEQVTYAELLLSVAGQSVGGMYQPETGAAYDGPRLPAIVLAEGLTRRWWTLLHEPQRTLERQPRDEAFEARHRLDSLTPGYVFPPLGLWSAGETMSAQMFSPDLRFQTQRFQPPESSEPWSLNRGEVEEELNAFVQNTLDRISQLNCHADELKESWDRIIASTLDPEEREWCVNSGRLGLDPYDPDTPNLARISSGISESLFGDICEAADEAGLQRTCDWVRSASSRLPLAQPISLQSFGTPPRRELSLPGYKHGYDAAKMLRLRLKLPLDPPRAVDQVLGGADRKEQGSLDDHAPDTIEGLIRRQLGEFRAAVPARSPRQRRFRLCRATYLAWRAGSNTEAAATPAETFRQQASRAFAAELMAPASLIKERFGRIGLTSRSVDKLADEWMCPPRTIVHQARNHGVVVKGAETAAYY